MFVSGSLLNFASYAFAPQSMLASLESVQFVTNILFGKFLLKAKVTTKMYIGTVITVLGTVVAVLFSSSTVKDLDIEVSRSGSPCSVPLFLLFLSLAQASNCL